MLMAGSNDTLPDDINALKALLTEQQATIRKYHYENTYLREQLNTLIAKRFGPSSEKHVPDQLGLFNEVEHSAEDEGDEDVSDESLSVPAHNRKKPGRKPLPDYIERVEVLHDLPEEEKLCPHDGTALQRIGEEISEQLDVIPAKVQVLRHIRPKYSCPCCREGIKTALMPPQPIPRSIASPGLLAYVATAKYVDALPLYRQEDILKRAGIELPRATLALWMMKLGELVLPLINLLRDSVLEHGIVQMDETTVQVLKKGNKAACSKSYMWVQRGGPPDKPVVLFDYDASRGGGVPLRLLEGYRGYLQCDGYEGYGAIGKREGITLVGCWAHARRKFDEAIKAQGKKGKAKAGRATKGLSFIQKLYRIEKVASELTPDERYALRQEQAVPLLNEIREWLDKSLPEVPPQSAVGKALSYLHGQWPKLAGYVEDGRLSIDNNAAERAIRPFVIGRNNWLFSDTVRGAEASARLYSLIATAKANSHEPYRYLCHVFKELPGVTSVQDVEALLPFNISPEALK
jgi:transposase